MSGRRVGAALAILAVAAALRCGVADATYPVRLLGDERYYLNVALNLDQGRGHVYDGLLRSWRPPAFPFLLSLFVPDGAGALADEKGQLADPTARWRTIRAFLRVQVVLSTLLVGAVMALAGALFGARTGLGAGLLAAVYPNFVAYAHYLWSETLFALLVTSALAGVVRGAHREHAGLVVASGIGFGLAALTREVALPVAAIAGAWWIATAAPAQRRAAWIRAAGLVGVAVLVVLPWTWRNTALHGRVVPVATVGWFAAAQGNALEERDWRWQDGPRHVRFEREYFALSDEMERMDFARAKALECAASEQPAWLAKKLFLNPTLVLSPDSYVLYKLARGAYGEIDPDVERRVRLVVTWSYAAVFALGVLGLAASTGRERWLVVAILAAVGTVHVLANGDTRFRLPWMPLVIAYACHALRDPSFVRARLSGRAAIAPACVLLYFFGVSVPYFLEYGGRQ